MANYGEVEGPQPTSSPIQSYERTSSPRTESPTQYPNRESSKENAVQGLPLSPARKPMPMTTINRTPRGQGSPLSPVHINNSSDSNYPPTLPARLLSYSADDTGPSRSVSAGTWETELAEPDNLRHPSEPMPVTQSIPYRQRSTTELPLTLQQPQMALLSSASQRSLSYRKDGSEDGEARSRPMSRNSPPNPTRTPEIVTPLQYHHQQYSDGGIRLLDNRASRTTVQTSKSGSPPSSPGETPAVSNQHLAPTTPVLPRPASAYSSTSDLAARGRTRSPQLSPNLYARGKSISPGPGYFPDSRPLSYVDLLNVPYPQPPPAPTSLDHTHLRTAVGSNASLLSTKKTLEMYRANVKKTNDPAIQYEFAVFMVNAAQEAAANGLDDGVQRQPTPQSGRDLDGPDVDNSTAATVHMDSLREARQILQKLADRSYPFAQYYLADGYSSGLFSKGKEDYERAFPLFVAASKHGHAEAGYRAALCYEFGWGTRKDPLKAVQFYRQSASKNHPGAMLRLGKACLAGDMGLGNRYREGLKWLKRAAESADFQYNSAPYDLGLLHETGYGDDVFQDESYAAQLYTQSADLGHAEANYRLGDAYEHGKLHCPRDPALSVHFYTGAAQRGHPVAMMALCAWYMIGAELVLDKDENEAYEWARKAAECGTFHRSVTTIGALSLTTCIRSSQGGIRGRLLHRDWHWLPPRPARGKRLVRQGRRPWRRTGQTPHRRDPRSRFGGDHHGACS